MISQLSKPSPRLIPCGVVLRNEIDAWNPKRDKGDDGWIGDAAHQATTSDHNPDSRGLVHAIDVDKDGIVPNRLVAVAIGDIRVEYVIYNRTIWSRKYGFKARKYTGPNPHLGHVHISFRYGVAYENNVAAWNVKPPTAPVPTPKPRPPVKVPHYKLGSRTLRYVPGKLMTGDDILYIQKFIGSKRCGPATGIFDAKTKSGVMWYQNMRDIAVDGIVGKNTFREMGVTWKG